MQLAQRKKLTELAISSNVPKIDLLLPLDRISVAVPYHDPEDLSYAQVRDLQPPE